MSVDNTRRDCAHKIANHQHGTRNAFALDRCRCTPCRTANSAYERDRKRRKAYAQWNPELANLVDAEPVRAHLRELMAAGMGWKRIAHAAGLSPSSVYTILYGKLRNRPDDPESRPPRSRILRANADALLAVTLDLADGAVVDSTGTARRLQALVAIGWSGSKLAARLGIQKGNFTPLLHGTSATTVATARTVRALYDELWNTAPPREEWRDKIAYSRTLRFAAQRGWLPPLAWDDDTIDDPAHQPLVETILRPAREPRNVPAEQRAADVLELRDTGESWERIAARLGVKLSTLEASLRRAGHAVPTSLYEAQRKAS